MRNSLDLLRRKCHEYLDLIDVVGDGCEADGMFSIQYNAFVDDVGMWCGEIPLSVGEGVRIFDDNIQSLVERMVAHYQVQIDLIKVQRQGVLG